MTPPLNRRDFLAQTTAAAATAALAANAGAMPLRPVPEEQPAQERRPTRSRWARPASRSRSSAWAPAAIGSGQASNQTRLGVKDFTKVVRHALDHGVTFFDVADQYGSHVYLREALKGVPRDQYGSRPRPTPPSSPTPRATSSATGWSWASTTSTSSCCTA